jgi:hypothetical protein
MHAINAFVVPLLCSAPLSPAISRPGGGFMQEFVLEEFMPCFRSLPCDSDLPAAHNEPRKASSGTNS